MERAENVIMCLDVRPLSNAEIYIRNAVQQG